MKAYESSRTAYGTTLFRAIESRRPEGDRVCFDPMAKEFLEPPVKMIARIPALSRRALKKFDGRGLGASYGFPVVRTRVIDDLLEERLRDGIKQLVIIGAGFDSRAYRFKEIPGKVTVFEIDHPATQGLKTKKVKKLLGGFPGHVLYVPVDLDRDDLWAGLMEKGYVSTVRTLYICEGLTMYLGGDAIDGMFSSIAGCSGPGSIIVFDYAYESAVNGTSDAEDAKRWLEFLNNLGEPPRFGVPEGGVGDFLSSRGFKLLSNMTGPELESEYFKKNGRGQKVDSFIAIATAEVAG